MGFSSHFRSPSFVKTKRATGVLEWWTAQYVGYSYRNRWRVSGCGVIYWWGIPDRVHSVTEQLCPIWVLKLQLLSLKD
jgi:hypothetical protein